jgi:hypothetical protein
MLCLLSVVIAGSSGHTQVPILEYIKNTWSVLTRSHKDLATAAIDPKFHPLANGRWPVRVGSHEYIARVEREWRGDLSERRRFDR